jgi:hypothetical protein
MKQQGNGIEAARPYGFDRTGDGCVAASRRESRID